MPAPTLTSLTKTDSFEFLCACARTTLRPEHLSLISGADYESFDWPIFLRLAEHHAVLPLVARNLTNYSRQLPADLGQQLHSLYETNLKRNLWFASELGRILGHLEKARVRAIAYKGPVLAESAYGDLGLRSFSDLDLLISPADFNKAKDALAEIGYRTSGELPPAVERFYLRRGYECAFDSSAGKNLVELQWNLLPHFYAVNFASADFTIDHLMTRAKSSEVCGREMRSLSPEDSLLALCLHAAKHLWTRLIWIVDIAQSLDTGRVNSQACQAPTHDSQAIDMRMVMARAQALGIRRILAISLWLSNRLLGAAIPREAQPLIAEDTEVAKYGEKCISRMSDATTYHFESSAYFREMFKLRERPADRLRYLWRLVWTPGSGDIGAVELPEILFPLYHVVRVGRLLSRLM